MIKTEATGRAALTGNPADVYLDNALVLAYSIQNSARVTIEDSNKLTISASDSIDPSHRLALGALSHFNINQPMKLHYDSNIPFNSGLGGSASILVAIIAALNKKFSLNLSTLEISKHALTIEHELGIKSGWQDRAAAAFGSSLIDCKNFTCNKLLILPENMYVAYWGKEGSSGYIHEKGLEKSNKEFLNLMAQTIEITKQAHKAIQNKNWIKLGNLMNQNWEIREKTLGLTKKDKEMKDFILKHGCYANQTGSGGAAVIYDPKLKLKPLLQEKHMQIVELILNGGVKIWTH